MAWQRLHHKLRITGLRCWRSWRRFSIARLLGLLAICGALLGYVRVVFAEARTDGPAILGWGVATALVGAISHKYGDALAGRILVTMCVLGLIAAAALR